MDSNPRRMLTVLMKKKQAVIKKGPAMATVNALHKEVPEQR